MVEVCLRVQDCEAALELDSCLVKAACRRAHALRELGQHRAALAACASFLGSFPGHEKDIEDLHSSLRDEVQHTHKANGIFPLEPSLYV